MKRRWGSSISIDVDLDLDEIYSQMDSSDCKEMASWLYEDGYLDEYQAKNLTSHVTGWNWEEVCNKLSSNQLRLTNEEEEVIKKIANRL